MNPQQHANQLHVDATILRTAAVTAHDYQAHRLAHELRDLAATLEWRAQATTGDTPC